jgi:hypothetical protein
MTLALYGDRSLLQAVLGYLCNIGLAAYDAFVVKVEQLVKGLRWKDFELLVEGRTWGHIDYTPKDASNKSKRPAVGGGEVIFE